MIHDPKVLILDEPTTGLDPNQLTEIRELIRKVGKEKTVMLSTHIMQEVEAVCDRVIIVNKGIIVADQETAKLQQGNSEMQVITVEFDNNPDREALLALSLINEVKLVKNNTWVLSASGTEDIRPIIFQFAVERKITVLMMTKEERRIEDVFKQLTQS